MDKELRTYQKPEKTVEEVFQTLKLLESEENGTQCVGTIKEKIIVSVEPPKEETKAPVKLSRFKQEMLDKKH